MTSVQPLPMYLKVPLGFIVGVILLLGVTANAEVNGHLLHTGYRKPYFIFWAQVAPTLLLYLPIHILLRVIYQALRYRSFYPTLVYKDVQEWLGSTLKENNLSFIKLLLYSIPLTTILSLDAYFINTALALAPPSTVIAIWNGNAIYIYLLSVLLLGDRLTLHYTIGIFIAIAGGVVIALGKVHDGSGSHVLWGIASTIFAGICVSCYGVFFAKLVGKGGGFTLGSLSTFTQGIIISFQGLLVFPILHYTGIEEFVFPAVGLPLYLVLASMSLIAVVQAAFLYGILIVSPLFVTMSTMLAISTTTITDIFLHDLYPNLYSIIGAVAIAIGFVILQTPQWKALTYSEWIKAAIGLAFPPKQEVVYCSMDS